MAKLNGPAMGYGITAHRSPASVAGAGCAALKGPDGPLLFPTFEEAQAEAQRLNASTVSANVYYTADPEPQETRANG